MADIQITIPSFGQTLIASSVTGSSDRMVSFTGSFLGFIASPTLRGQVWAVKAGVPPTLLRLGPEFIFNKPPTATSGTFTYDWRFNPADVSPYYNEPLLLEAYSDLV